MIGFVHKAKELRATRRYLIAVRAWELREVDRLSNLPTTPARERGIERRLAHARDLGAVLRALPYMPSLIGGSDNDDPAPEVALAEFLDDESGG